MEQTTFQSTALKHRPQVFADLIGQEHVSTSLANAIKQQRIAHGYLFSGPRGVGKTSTARILAKSLNCEQGPTAEPCGRCSNCVEIATSSSLDVSEIDGASNRGIDRIRELRDSVLFAPSKSRYKIYIIDEVHMLTSEAFNALLKTLEEPPAYVVFIFATTEPAKVKLTIRSRCQHYRFKRIAARRITEHLQTICAQEGITAGGDALFLIARAADGSMRDAQSLLDQVTSYAGGPFSEEQVREVTGLLDSSVYFDFFTYLLDKDVKSLLRQVADMDENGIDFTVFVTGLAETLRNLVLIVEGAQENELEIVAEDYRTLSSFYNPRAEDAFTLDHLINLLENVIQLGRELYHASNPRRIFELHLFQLINFRNQITPAAIMERIENLFQQLGINPNAAATPIPQTRKNPGLETPPLKSDSPPRRAAATPAAAGQETPPPSAPAIQPVQQTGPPEQPQQAPKKKAANPQPKQAHKDAAQLLQALINYEEQHNTMVPAFLQKAVNIDFRNKKFVLYFDPRDRFYKEQIEESYREEIMSFLSEQCGETIRLECRFTQEGTAPPTDAEQNTTPDTESTEQADVTQTEEEPHDEVVETIKQQFKGEIMADNGQEHDISPQGARNAKRHG